MSKLRTIAVCTALLLGAVGVIAVLQLTEPRAERETATRETAMLVDVQAAERGSFRPVIRAVGTVEAAADVLLSPQVSGRVVAQAPSFRPGGSVAEGELLLRLDPEDFRNRLRQAQARLRQAQTELEIEQGRAAVALQEYRMRGKELDEINRARVLREPQLAAAQAAVDSAQVAVSQARLELSRTEIRAPFDALVLRRDATIGSQVTPGDQLGRIVGTDIYWVVVTVPLAKLPYVDIPTQANGDGARVQLRDPNGWPADTYREGRVADLIGALSEQTRMARLLITVEDPLARNDPGQPPLLIGSFVEVSMQARELRDVVRMPREFLRKGDTVWVDAQGELAIRKVEVTFLDGEFAYLSAGLTEADQIVTTDLATVVEGARLRTAASAPDNFISGASAP